VKRLFVNEVADEYTRENFRTVSEFVRDEALLKGQFKFFEYSFTAAGTHTPLHTLGYKPLDVITLAVSRGATVVWDYDAFTKVTVKLTVSAPCRVRVFLGTYREGET